MGSNATITLRNSRLTILVIGSKWCVAAALVGSLWLPFTSCSLQGRVQEQYVTLSFANADVIAWYVWPIPILLLRLLLPRLRGSITVVVIEGLLAIAAWCSLTMRLIGAAFISFGGIAASTGYDLAASALEGYLALSLIDTAIIVLARRK